MIVRPSQDDFDWSLERSIPAPPQLATTCYLNRSLEVVIRQRDDGFDDGDTLVLLTVSNAIALGQALIDLARSAQDQDRDLDAPVRPPEGPPAPLLQVMEAAE